MDRASSLIFPGSRTLAGWWRQLAPFHPVAFAVGYGYLHRIEAPVITLTDEPVEPFLHLVLQAIALESDARCRLDTLNERLRLPMAVTRRVVAGMQNDGLLALVRSEEHTSEL